MKQPNKWEKFIYFQIFFFFTLIRFDLSGEDRLSEAISSPPLILQVKDREIIVNGKKSQVYEIVQPNGIQGLVLKKGEPFNVIVENQIHHPTGIHWHGLILPNNQDGVPFVTQPPIAPGARYHYRFPIVQSGTYWMHAHYGLQEQQLLAAPLILYDPKDQSHDQQEIMMFLSDFSFRNPLEIFKELRNQKQMKMPQEVSHEHDLNDVKYDAFLTNWRTLSDPEVVNVKPEKMIRLRIINGSSSTNFFIQLGKLLGEAIAIDGWPIHPLKGSQFELATAQRIDIRIKIPEGKGVYPILAQGEGLTMQTGLILATINTPIPSFKEEGNQTMRALSYQQELLLKAQDSLPQKEINRRLILNLEGNMAKYEWLLNGKAWPDHQPLLVKQGERVELTFVNHTEMAHPMHLHGHFFQVTEINGQPLKGALRDTILVLPHSTVKVQFDANHPGHWALHCHHLYHQYAGMMTTLNYEGFKGPIFPKVDKTHE